MNSRVASILLVPITALFLGLIGEGVAFGRCGYCGLCPFPVAFASKYSICPGEVVELGVGGDAPCIWSPLEGLSDPGSCSPSAQPSQTTTYFVESTDPFRCIRWTSGVTVTVQHPTAPIIQAPASVSAGEAHVTASATPGGASYRWEIANGTIQQGQGDYVVVFSVASRPGRDRRLQRRQARGRRGRRGMPDR
jgi:hypothetical protein